MCRTCVFTVAMLMTQVARDLGVGPARTDHRQHLELPFAQLVEPGRRPPGRGRAAAKCAIIRASTAGAITGSPAAARRRRRRAPRTVTSLRRKPTAPARITSTTSWSASNVVSASTLRGAGVHHPPGRLDAVHPGHPQVHQDHVGRVLRGGSHRRRPVPGLGDDVDAGELQDETQPLAHQGLVVGDEHSRHRAAPVGVGRQADADVEAPLANHGLEGPAEQLGPVPHAGEPAPRLRLSNRAVALDDRVGRRDGHRVRTPVDAQRDGAALARGGRRSSGTRGRSG